MKPLNANEGMTAASTIKDMHKSVLLLFLLFPILYPNIGYCNSDYEVADAIVESITTATNGVINKGSNIMPIGNASIKSVEFIFPNNTSEEMFFESLNPLIYSGFENKYLWRQPWKFLDGTYLTILQDRNTLNSGLYLFYVPSLKTLTVINTEHSVMGYSDVINNSKYPTLSDPDIYLTLSNIVYSTSGYIIEESTDLKEGTNEEIVSSIIRLPIYYTIEKLIKSLNALKLSLLLGRFTTTNWECLTNIAEYPDGVWICSFILDKDLIGAPLFQTHTIELIYYTNNNHLVTNFIRKKA